MLKQVLYVQWLSSRAVVVALGVIAFALPLLTVYYGGDLRAVGPSPVAAWLYAAQQIGLAIPVLAMVVGLTLGMLAWAPDHLGKHVYALSLPVPRSMYVTLRFAASLVLVGGIVLALGLGALLATLAVDLPRGIHAYPVQLTARFALATLTCFALFFAISIATKRAVLLTLGVIGGVLLADVLRELFGATEGASVTGTVFILLTSWPGPFSVLMGRWALFDV